MAQHQRDPAKDKSWRNALGRFVASGLNSRAICKREWLTESALYA